MHPLAPGTIHVVSKQDNNNHASIHMPSAPLPDDLAPSSVRVKTKLIALTSANLAYAALGDFLKWWDAYPVPPVAPAPYNDPAKWGIVPAWGYAEVAASTIPSLAVGTTLFGLWPTSSYPVDLHLSPGMGGLPGFYVEDSPARSTLMRLYNIYSELPEGAEPDELSVFKAVWSCGWALNKATFGEFALHPFGVKEMPWSKADADLSKAVVVLLSASSKTARSIAWQMVHSREKGTGPLGLVQTTSVPGKMAKFEESEVQVKALGYDEEFPVDWAKKLNAERVVVIDMGGRDGVLQKVYDAASKVAASPNVLIVGSEPKIVGAREAKAIFSTDGSKIEKVLVNTSPLFDRMQEVMGPAKFIADMDEAWERFAAEGGFGPLNLKHFDRVEGEAGIEGAWEGYVQGTHEPTDGIVVRL